MQSLAKHIALAAALAAVACSDDSAGDPDLMTGDASPSTVLDGSITTQIDGAVPPPTQSDAGPTPAGEKTGCGAIEMSPPLDGLQVELPLSVPPAAESEYCMLFVADKDVYVNWTDGRYTKGSHHGNIYRTGYKDVIPTKTITGETIADATKPHPCPTPQQVWDARGVFGTGRPVTRATIDASGNPEPGVKVLPSDVAVKISKGDVLLLNFHMINATEKPIDSCLKMNLHGIPAAQAKHEAGLLFAYNAFITVPPMGESTARMACPVDKDYTLASANSHMHARGDGYIANLLDKAPTDPTAAVVKELYKGTAWDDPRATVFDVPVQLKAGQYIDFQCHYTNKEPRSVSQGFASTDEMCMFTGMYWPMDLDFENCRKPKSATRGASAGITYGYGSKTGAEFLQCFWSTPERVFTGAFDDPKRYDTLSCFTQTCPKASPGTNPYLSCLAQYGDQCTMDCTDAQASFQAACARGTCKEEFGSDGTDGTCATSVGQDAVAACTKPSQLSAFAASCTAGQCATACTDPTSTACTTCIGMFDGSPTNPSCINVLVGACAQDQGKKLATACVSECFTGCITREISACSGSCLNSVACKNEYQTLATATCN